MQAPLVVAVLGHPAEAQPSLEFHPAMSRVAARVADDQEAVAVGIDMAVAADNVRVAASVTADSATETSSAPARARRRPFAAMTAPRPERDSINMD